MVEVIAAILVFSIVPVAVIGGAVAAVIAARRTAEQDGSPVDDGIGSVRRQFIYLLALVGVTFAAIGVSMIIGGALDAIVGGALLLDRRESLAVALAFTVVGTPAWLLFMLLAQRSVQAHPVERRALTRRCYFAFVRVIALSVVAWNLVAALEMVTGLATFSGGAGGYTAAWGGVWLIHQRLASNEPAFTAMTQLIDRLGLYFGALLGLLMVLGGAIGVISAPLSEAYDRVLRGSLIAASWDRDLRGSAIVFGVGLLIWAWHWLLHLRRGDRPTTLWRTYVFLAGALLGVTLAITPAAAMLYSVLEWFAGRPDADTAVAHFTSFPASGATLLMGLANWAYHRAVLIEAGDAHSRSGPERVYRYVLSAAGLVTTAVGLAQLIALAADSLSGATGDLVEAAGWWRNPLLLGVTLVIVGLPLWARYWRDTQRALETGAEERGAPSRRVYVFGTVGIAIFALLVSLTVVLYQVFRAILDGDLSRLLLYSTDWGLGIALTAGAIAYYHFLVLREDQAATPIETPVAARARQVVLLTPGDAAELAAELDGIPGVHLRAWRRTDGDGLALPEERREALRAAIEAADTDRLIAIVARGDFELVPFVEESR
ncbi:MAG: DUF5671 domain-containing protein [Chloroflexota bacterium]